MPKPTIARTVIAVGGVAASNGNDLAPATITRVWSQREDGSWLVNLVVFPDASNQPRAATSVYLYPDEDAARAGTKHESTTAAFWPTIS